ncbi:MAG: hypothetical protein RIB65_08300, partial [Ilumatobacter fluminis]|uniref:hypothetical protein n=1 Tax=Ilumatobacter fluminis TaxID=467091 RepID=UPI0032ECDCC8
MGSGVVDDGEKRMGSGAVDDGEERMGSGAVDDGEKSTGSGVVGDGEERAVTREHLTPVRQATQQPITPTDTNTRTIDNTNHQPIVNPLEHQYDPHMGPVDVPTDASFDDRCALFDEPIARAAGALNAAHAHLVELTEQLLDTDTWQQGDCRT